jgi:hypothetical protein
MQRRREVPEGWRQFWSDADSKKGLKRPYYQHTGSKEVVWEIPKSFYDASDAGVCVCGYTHIHMRRGCVCVHIYGK